MRELIYYFEKSFYTHLLSFFIAIIALIISLQKNKEHKSLKNFKFYFLAYIIACLLIFSTVLFAKTRYYFLPKIVAPALDFAFTIIEFLMFASFFKNLLAITKYVTQIRRIQRLFILVALGLTIRDILAFTMLRQETLQNIFTIQAICLIILCIFYYITLFQIEPIPVLKGNPEFLVATGLSFLLISTLPLSIFINYIERYSYGFYRYLFSIFHVFYCLLFLMIIRAYLCKPTTTK